MKVDKYHDYPITRYIGFAIIALAVLEVLEITNFKPLFLLGFSFSALLLTFVDFIEIKAEEKNDPFKYRKIKLGVLNTVSKLLYHTPRNNLFR